MARILLIEDDDLVRELLQVQLEELEHAVVPAAHGGEGLAVFPDGGFDLVITDILMPDVEGLETIKRLRQIDPRVAIIAMSGGARSRPSGLRPGTGIDVLKFADVFGATCTLSKPFTRLQLMQAIDACLSTEPSPDGGSGGE